MRNDVFITTNGSKFHKSRGCVHLRYARRRHTIAFIPRSLAEKCGDKPCKTCFPQEAK